MSHYSNKAIIFIVTVILCFSFATGLSMLFLKNYEDSQKSVSIINLARVKVNPILESIRKNYNKAGQHQEFYSILKSKAEKINIKMKIVDLNGFIIFDSESGNVSGTPVKFNLEEMVYYNGEPKREIPGYVELAFPIVINGSLTANAICLIPTDDLLADSECSFFYSYIPSIVGLVLTSIVLILLYFSLSDEIIKPIKKLNCVISTITRGNFDLGIKSCAQNEVGELTRAFELMRIELKNSHEEKEKLERERKELVASISHEIKTPLSSIKAYAEGLRDGIAKDTETFHKYVNIIITKTGGIVKLVNDLLQHSLQDLGSFTMRKEAIYSRQLLLNIIEPIQLKMADKPLSLRVEGDIPNVLVEVDAGRIEQVIINLIQNAEKYAFSEGEISVSAVLEDDCLLVSVSDNGNGIPPEELPFVFNRFYRGNQSKQSNIEGVGLGLSICKYIIEEHGGIIFAESALNKGSIFRFTIPKI